MIFHGTTCQYNAVKKVKGSKDKNWKNGVKKLVEKTNILVKKKLWLKKDKNFGVKKSKNVGGKNQRLRKKKQSCKNSVQIFGVKSAIL